MINKEYWIYSEGNAGEAILARCEGKFIWLLTPLKSRPRVFVCFYLKMDVFKTRFQKGFTLSTRLRFHSGSRCPRANEINLKQICPSVLIGRECEYGRLLHYTTT